MTQLVMFHPVDQPMERGWVGRVDGDHVVHLAAQTLEAFFTGGGKAREHAVYPRAAVRLLAPVLHPPAIRVFEDETTFEFANPAAVVGPDAGITSHSGLAVLPRLAGVVGADEEIAGFTVYADWRRRSAAPPKDRDFAHGLGPVVLVATRLDGEVDVLVWVGGQNRLRERFADFSWEKARELAAQGTRLRPGDLLAGPAVGMVDAIGPGDVVEVEVDGIGTLRALPQQASAA